MSGLIVGCGGNSRISYSASPLYYRGTVTIANTGYLSPGTATAIADVTPGQDLSIVAMGPTTSATITNDKSFAVLVSNGVIVKGKMEETDSPGSLSFNFLNGSSVLVSGTLSNHSFPTLGKTASVPPAGNYNGDLLVVSNGHARSFGTVTSIMDSAGNWTAFTNEQGGWIGDAVVSGQFMPNATVSGTTLVSNGSVIVEQTDPAYSFDGKTLIINIGGLFLGPGGCWLTLTKS